MSAEELKAKGNAAFSSKNYDEAIDFFTQGIAIDPNNHVLFSNRSACYAGKKVILSSSLFNPSCRTSGAVRALSIGLSMSVFDLY